MKELEKREFKDEELIRDYLRRAEEDFGPKNVKAHKGINGETIIVIQNSTKTLTRKEHEFPEFARKQGD